MKFFTCIALSLSILCSSCLGSFSAFNGLKDWNQDLTDSKFVNNLVFWALNIIPVYGLFFLGDTIIFNVIEFWGGSNPLSMKDGESETQIVDYKGSTLQMTASKNKFAITVLEGDRKGEHIELVFKTDDNSWNVIKENGEMVKLSSIEDGLVVYHLPDGDTVKMSADTPREIGLQKINNAVYNYTDCVLAEAH